MDKLNSTTLKNIIWDVLASHSFEMANSNFNKAFSHLERNHFICQQFPLAHSIIHLRMLKFSIITFRPLEILVQFIYSTFSFKFSLLKIFPKGNTGGANAVFKGKMQIPNDLAIVMMNSKKKY
jgi:Protein of unknown function (DUF3703)